MPWVKFPSQRPSPNLGAGTGPIPDSYKNCLSLVLTLQKGQENSLGFLFLTFSVCACAVFRHLNTCMIQPMRSEDKWQELVLTFHQVGPRRNQVIRLCDNYLCPLSHLTRPGISSRCWPHPCRSMCRTPKTQSPFKGPTF